MGASDDGGFYLIGLRKNYPQIFANVEWSSPKVFEQITENIERARINLKLVPAWYDADAPDDLRRLRGEIFENETARQIAPRTFRWLIENSGVLRQTE